MPLTKVKSGGVSDSITLTSPDINAPDIDGGTIDNAVIGGSTAAAGTFTTITSTGGSSSNWNTAYGWGDHSTQSYATQTYVGTAVSNLVDSSPAALDTLNELAAALGDDPNFATTVTNSIALKAPLASPSFTGNVGIGVTPSTKLHLGGTAPLDSIIRQDSTVSGTNWEIGERAAGKWQIWEDDSDSVVATFMSSGNVGIGISNPSDYYSNFNDLVLGNTSTHSGMTIASGTAHDGTISFADGTSGTELYQGYMQYNHGVNSLTFGTASANRMVIDSSGNVGIGVSNPSDYYAKDLVVTGPSEGGITIAATGNHTNYLLFADSTSGVARYSGMVEYAHTIDAMSFRTSSVQRMRIDSSGRVTMPYQPTWGASSLSNTSSNAGTTSAGTLVFSGVLNNNGNHYSNSTGLFTAPVAGQYFVTFSGLYDDHYNNTGAVYIRRNTENLYRGYHQNSGSNYLQISMSGVVQCSVGDTISIYSGIAGWHIGGETSFSGFLIG